MNSIPVVYYHSIAPKKNKNWFRNYLTVELKYFEIHLKIFKSLGYRSISLDEFYDINKSGLKSKERLVVFTFDDGYLDNYVFAAPILKKYGFTGTIFVNSDYIDRKSNQRYSLEDYWSGKVSWDELPVLGFLNPEEMRYLDKSGVLKIESHTKTHDKYKVSDKIIGFHYPCMDCLYPVGEKYPELKPYYQGNKSFEELLPYGTPFYERKSSVIAKKVEINPELNQEIVAILKPLIIKNAYNFNLFFEKIKPIYERYRKNNKIILSIESDFDYKKRIYDELFTCKIILEQELERPIHFLCWPHGDNNEISNCIAEQVGYKATTLGKGQIYKNQNILRFDRFGLANVHNSLLLTKLKARYKIGEYRKEFPWVTASKLYHYFKNPI